MTNKCAENYEKGFDFALLLLDFLYVYTHVCLCIILFWIYMYLYYLVLYYFVLYLYSGVPGKLLPPFSRSSPTLLWFTLGIKIIVSGSSGIISGWHWGSNSKCLHHGCHYYYYDVNDNLDDENVEHNLALVHTGDQVESLSVIKLSDIDWCLHHGCHY